MMNHRTDIPTALYEDEIVCYLAERYQTSPREVVRHFLAQEGGAMPGRDRMPGFRLEKNELEMLRGLTDGKPL